jgi:formylglycine-generating enzyme required for sulfatase activity
MGKNPSFFQEPRNPVELVCWDDVQNFIKKLNNLTGHNLRLPTEAESELAARGGNHSKNFIFSGSNNPDEVAWYSENSDQESHHVGQKQPNELGIYDMSGNVWEWCSDWYGAYGEGDETNPQGPDAGTSRVLRGGSWLFNAVYCRITDRDEIDPEHRDSCTGFRLAAPE